jgi:hypothetical protein
MERLMQQRLLELLEGGEFAFVEVGEVVYFGAEGFKITGNALLFQEWWERKLKVFNLLTADMRDSDPCLNAKNVCGEGPAPNEKL